MYWRGKRRGRKVATNTGKTEIFLLNLYDSIFVEMESPTDLSLEYLDWKERTLAMQTSHHEVVSLVV